MRNEILELNPSVERAQPERLDLRCMRSAARFYVPLNLSEWVDKEVLKSWIAREVSALNWDHPQVIEYLRQMPQSHPKVLVSLLSYAYLTGTFDSEDIAYACRREPVYLELSEGLELTAKTIQRFRREHRGLLKWVLAQVMESALRFQLQMPGQPLPAGLRRALAESATERLDLARHLDGEAQWG